MPTLSRRPAIADDAPFLMGLRRQTMDAHLEASGADTGEEAHLARLFHRYDAAQILLEAGEPVGLLKVTRDAAEWKVVQIQLVPRLQGQGLGATLLREVIDEAAAAGAALTLGVLKSNPAKGLYERLGFVVEGDADGEWLMRWRG